MGMWAASAFDNDTAMDWASGLSARPDEPFGKLEAAFRAVAEADTLADQDAIFQCVGAAAALLHSLGISTARTVHEVETWAKNLHVPTPEMLLPLGVAAMRKVSADPGVVSNTIAAPRDVLLLARPIGQTRIAIVRSSSPRRLRRSVNDR